jgi:hypothetical protein
MNETDKKPTEKAAAKATDAKMVLHEKDHKQKLLLIGGGVVLGALIVLLVVLVAVGIKGAKDHDSRYSMRGMHERGSMMDRKSDGAHGERKHSRGYDSNTMVHGTVTEISDTSMVIIGNGVSKKITLNTSTTYGDKKPSVNDSVMAHGTTSGDTFTATSVRVVNH